MEVDCLVLCYPSCCLLIFTVYILLYIFFCIINIFDKGGEGYSQVYLCPNVYFIIDYKRILSVTVSVCHHNGNILSLFVEQ